MRLSRLIIGWLTISLLTGEPARAEEVSFVDDVLPIFQRHCTGCHGADDQQSSLRLDWGRGALDGGDSGSAVVPGDSASSLLYQALVGQGDVSPMPPEGEPAPSDEQIAVIQRWIDAGAVVPQDEMAPAAQRRVSQHWAFQPLRQDHPPPLAEAPSPLDAFIRKRLVDAGLEPNPSADRATQLRRVHLDLLGLPPPPELVSRFLADERPDAYERVVDQLLASPAYGERWARVWLDVARYADSNGFTRDMPRSIWPYRDWVVAAINRGQTFDEFTIEQIAGDLLPDPSREQLIATGFHRNTLVNEEGGADPEQFRVEATVDRVNTTGAAFLGLTVGCAQCHEHKYDPLSQREYYQLFAFFNNVAFDPQDQLQPMLEVPSPEQQVNGQIEKRDQLAAEILELERAVDADATALLQAQRRWEGKLPAKERADLPFDVKNALDLPEADRSDQHRRDLARYYRRTKDARDQFPLLQQIAELRAQQPEFARTLVIREAAQPRPTFVMIRGDFLRPGKQVSPDVPEVLPPLPAGDAPRTRLDLARWLVREDQPLTPRVLVNRDWIKFFGRGLVATENDFGAQGDPPSHPELLDWLAAELIRHDWEVKSLHRRIVTSAAYRQSSHAAPSASAADPINRWLGRQARIRLDAEAIRDSGLAASSLLSRTLGGEPVMPPQPDGVFEFTQDKKTWKTARGKDRFRRGLYTYLWRSSLHPSLTVFDFPDPNVACTRRNRSNTPLQALTLANDAAFMEFARGLAVKTLHVDGGDPARLRFAWLSAVSREPTTAESSALQTFLDGQRQAFAADPTAAKEFVGDLSLLATTQSDIPGHPDDRELAAWVAVARVLLNLDEFITRE
jgi:mono/diheme cytochrome c family protein